MGRGRVAFGACLALLFPAGCTPPRPVPSVASRPPAANPVAANTAAVTPPQVLPDTDELNQELSIVASPQISRDRSLLPTGKVQDLGGGWVRYGPGRAGPVRRTLHKTGHSDVPFTAQVIVTHVLDYSDVFQTQAQAARAPLTSTQAWTTIYRYEYQTPGTWAYKDEQDGALTDKGRR